MFDIAGQISIKKISISPNIKREIEEITKSITPPSGKGSFAPANMAKEEVAQKKRAISLSITDLKHKKMALSVDKERIEVDIRRLRLVKEQYAIQERRIALKKQQLSLNKLEEDFETKLLRKKQMRIKIEKDIAETTLKTQRAQSISNKEAEKGLNTARKSAETVERGIKGLTERQFAQQNVFGMLAWQGERLLGWLAIAGTLYKVQQAFSEAVRGAIEFDKQLVEVTKVMSISDGETENLSSNLLSFAKKYGVASTEVAKAAAVYSQQGLSVSKVIALTNASILLANVSILSTADATETLTAVMNQFNISADDAVSIVDKLNEISNNFAVTEKDLSEAIKRSGDSAKVAGVSFETLAGYVAAVQERTRRGGEVIGTAFKTIFAKINTKKSIDEFNKLGIAAYDINGEFISVEKRLRQLSVAWSNMSNVQKINLAKATAGIRQYSIFLSLMDGFDSAIAATETTLNANGSAMEENAKIMSTMVKQIESVKQSWQELFVEISKSNILRGLGGALLTITDTLAKFLNMFNKDLLVGGVLAVGGVFAAKKISQWSKQLVEAKAYFSGVISGNTQIVQNSQVAAQQVKLAWTDAFRSAERAQANLISRSLTGRNAPAGVNVDATQELKDAVSNQRANYVASGLIPISVGVSAWKDSVVKDMSEAEVATSGYTATLDTLQVALNTFTIGQFSGAFAGLAKIIGPSVLAMGGWVTLIVAAGYATYRAIKYFTDYEKKLRLVEERYKKSSEKAKTFKEETAELIEMSKKAFEYKNVLAQTDAFDELAKKYPELRASATEYYQAIKSGADVTQLFAKVQKEIDAKKFADEMNVATEALKVYAKTASNAEKRASVSRKITKTLGSYYGATTGFLAGSIGGIGGIAGSKIGSKYGGDLASKVAEPAIKYIFSIDEQKQKENIEKTKVLFNKDLEKFSKDIPVKILPKDFDRYKEKFNTLSKDAAKNAVKALTDAGATPAIIDKYLASLTENTIVVAQKLISSVATAADVRISEAFRKSQEASKAAADNIEYFNSKFKDLSSVLQSVDSLGFGLNIESRMKMLSAESLTLAKNLESIDLSGISYERQLFDLKKNLEEDGENALQGVSAKKILSNVLSGGKVESIMGAVAGTIFSKMSEEEKGKLREKYPEEVSALGGVIVATGSQEGKTLELVKQAIENINIARQTNIAILERSSQKLEKISDRSKKLSEALSSVYNTMGALADSELKVADIRNKNLEISNGGLETEKLYLQQRANSAIALKNISQRIKEQTALAASIDATRSKYIDTLNRNTNDEFVKRGRLVDKEREQLSLLQAINGEYDKTLGILSSNLSKIQADIDKQRQARRDIFSMSKEDVNYQKNRFQEFISIVGEKKSYTPQDIDKLVGSGSFKYLQYGGKDPLQELDKIMERLSILGTENQKAVANAYFKAYEPTGKLQDEKAKYEKEIITERKKQLKNWDDIIASQKKILELDKENAISLKGFLDTVVNNNKPGSKSPLQITLDDLKVAMNNVKDDMVQALKDAQEIKEFEKSVNVEIKGENFIQAVTNVFNDKFSALGKDIHTSIKLSFQDIERKRANEGVF